MSTPTNLKPSNEPEITTSKIMGELLVESFDPISKYTYLYFRTLLSVLLKPHVVVASILRPPAEQLRQKLHMRLAELWKVSRADKLKRFRLWWVIDAKRKYYNPISFLAASVALLIISGSSIETKLPSNLKIHDAVMHDVLGLDTVTINEAWVSKPTRDRFIKKRQEIKETEKNSKNESFKKLSIFTVFILLSALFAIIAHRLYRDVEGIGLFVLGLYIFSILMIVNRVFEILVASLLNEYLYVVIILFIPLFYVVPSIYYVCYINKTALNNRKWLTWLLVPVYSIVFFFSTELLISPMNSVYANVSERLEGVFPIKLSEAKPM